MRSSTLFEHDMFENWVLERLGERSTIGRRCSLHRRWNGRRPPGRRSWRWRSRHWRGRPWKKKLRLKQATCKSRWKMFLLTSWACAFCTTSWPRWGSRWRSWGPRKPTSGRKRSCRSRPRRTSWSTCHRSSRSEWARWGCRPIWSSRSCCCRSWRGRSRRWGPWGPTRWASWSSWGWAPRRWTRLWPRIRRPWRPSGSLPVHRPKPSRLPWRRFRQGISFQSPSRGSIELLLTY